MTAPLRVLLVDDEPLARLRLRTLLGDAPGGMAAQVVGEAGDAVSAMAWLQHHPADLVLLDIHMPGLSGLGLAGHLKQQAQPPAVVFVTAHPDHAVQAFELDAVDYLTKPVRAERLGLMLQKVKRQMQYSKAVEHENVNNTLAIASAVLRVHDRGGTELVPLAEVLFVRAELKYLTVQTRQREHLMDGSLNDLEQAWGDRLLRIHRNALVSRWALRALERVREPDGTEGWALRLEGWPHERLAVSRRQLPLVRQAMDVAAMG